MDGKVALTFQIFKGDQLLRTETLTQPVIKVGKLSSSHLRIDDESVSRMHAVIEVTGPGEISIIDLGSTKGTLVNGQKVNKAKLQDGDEIVLGDTRIVLAVGVAAAEAAAPAVAARPAPTPSTPPTFAAPPRPAPTPSAPPAFAAPPRPAPTPSAPPAFAAAPAAPAPMARAAAPVGAVPSFGNDAAEDMGGARAIEVAALLADSVVEVKHITDPKSGKVSGMTKGLIAASAALFIMALVSFGYGVKVVQKDREDFITFTEVKKRPAIDFRETRINPAYDAMAFLGLGGGIVLLVWALSRVFEERKSPYFRIGSSKDAEFPTDALPGQSAFAMIAPQGNDFTFSWTQGMKGELVLDGRSTPLEQLPQTGPVPHKARYRVEIGNNTFLVSSVPAPKRTPTAFLAAMDGVFGMYLGVTGVAMLGFIMLLKFGSFDERDTLSLDSLSDSDRLANVKMKAQDDPKQEEQKNEDKDDGQQSGGTGTKQALDEGKMGKKDSTRAAGQYAIENRGVPPQLAKAQKQEIARNAGALGVLSAQSGGAFASITGTGDFSSGLEDRDIQGGLLGNEYGEMAGGYGFGTQGVGPGDGGTGLGTIGGGNYGAMGHGRGTGDGFGVGSGRGGMPGRSAGVPKVNIGNATAEGDLDKAIIRRYIRQKLPQIEHCYQKQLTVNANLSGTVTVQFTINGTGAVISAKGGGMGNRDVESCVEDAIRSIKFPAPTGGGFVNVSYPFNFRSS